MFSIILVWIFVASSFAIEQCDRSNISGYSSCACKLSTNKYINLYPLQNSSVIPRFTASNVTGKGEEDWKFSFNPCKPFSMFTDTNLTMLSCKDVAAARWTKSSQHVCQDLGDQETVEFDTTPYKISLDSNETQWSNITLIFSTAKEPKLKNRAIIHLLCNANMSKEDSTFQFLDESHGGHSNDYFLVLESPCACPGLCGEPPLPEPTSKPSKGDDDDDTNLIIGVSIGAVAFLLLVILLVICCRKSRKSGYTQV